MFRRVFTAPMLALSLLASAGVVADVEAASLPAGSATAVTQVAAPQVAAPQAPSAAFDCGAGLVATVCAVVLGPICRDRCLGDAAPAAPATAAGAAPAVGSVRQAAGARAGTTSADVTCAPGFEILCTVLGLTVCRNHPCGATPAASTSAVGIDCEIDLLCTLLGLTVCRHGCTFAAGADTVAINPGELCTVNIRPINPFCLLP